MKRLELIDIDRRAVEAARNNIDDPRAEFHWADLTGTNVSLAGLDFVVMNPPFHDGGTEDRASWPNLHPPRRRKPAQGRRAVAGGQSPPAL